MRTFFTIALSVVLTSALQAQNLNPNWKKELAAALEQFQACSAGEQNSGCSKIQGEVLSTVYKINDFYAQKSGRYMTVSEVSAFLKGNDSWTPLGPVYLQETLTKAQELANDKKAVVAVYQNAAAMGHVALIIPGDLEPSGSWGLNVPNTASFFLPEPDKSFVNKGLSFAFTKNMMKDIVLYVRTY